MKPHYLKTINLFDQSNRPSDVRVYDGAGNLLRTLKVANLLKRGNRFDPYRIYPVEVSGHKQGSRRMVSSRKGKLRGITRL
jgi:hypothetical protein